MYRLTKVATRAATLRAFKPVAVSPRACLPTWQHGSRHATRGNERIALSTFGHYGSTKHVTQ